MYMINLKIKYSDTITILESDNYGFMMRIWIVMNEKGIDVRKFLSKSSYIVEINGLLPIDDIKKVIDDQFNSETINLAIL